MSCIALLLTGWVVSDNAPGTPVGWTAPVVVGLALLYGGLVATLITLGESHRDAARYLLLALLVHLLPFGLSVWVATGWMEGTAYAFLSPWCWGVAGACGLGHLGGVGWRLRKLGT